MGGEGGERGEEGRRERRTALKRQGTVAKNGCRFAFRLQED